MSLNALSSRAIIGRYYAVLEAITGSSWIGAASNLFKSDQESESYKWLGMTPKLREWIAGRQAKGLRDNGIDIINKHYEATIDVMLQDVRRDKTGQIMARIEDLSKRTVEHWASLLTTLIENGESADCYDGQYFFDDDHSEGDSGTQCNTLEAAEVADLNVGTAAAPTIAEMEPAILNVIAYMQGYKDDQGEPMNADGNGWLIMCPKGKIFASALGAVKNQIINQSTATLPNTDWKLQVVCNPRLTWTTKFAVFRTDAPVKALIRQQETEPTLDAIAEGSELEFNEHKWRFGVDTWRNCGYGYWQYASINTLS